LWRLKRMINDECLKK